MNRLHVVLPDGTSEGRWRLTMTVVGFSRLGTAVLAGVRKLAHSLAGRRAAIIFSGANVDGATLSRVLAREI